MDGVLTIRCSHTTVLCSYYIQSRESQCYYTQGCGRCSQDLYADEVNCRRVIRTKPDIPIHRDEARLFPKSRLTHLTEFRHVIVCLVENYTVGISTSCFQSALSYDDAVPPQAFDAGGTKSLSEYVVLARSLWECRQDITVSALRSSHDTQVAGHMGEGLC